MTDLKHKGYFYGAVLYAFLIPFHSAVATVALGLWVLISIAHIDKSVLVKNGYLLLLPAMYLLYFTGIFTGDTPSFRFLESKLSFLVFPLLFYLNRYSAKQRDTILKAMVYGLAVAGIICLSYATYRSVHYNGVLIFAPNVFEGKGAIESILYGGNYYFGSFFSIFHQTVYFALYLCVGLIVLLFKTDLFSRKRAILFGFFFVVLLFLISNKAGLIAIGLIFLIKILTAKTVIYKKLVVLGVLAIALGALIGFNPRTRLSIEKIYNGALTLDKNARYGFSTRILSWDAALDLIKARPLLGYGFGDSQKKLNEVYEQKEYIFPLKESYNAHNQWLQTWMENGLLGVLVLGAVFLALLAQMSKNPTRFGLMTAIILVLLLNSLFESMFNRFSGVSFFSFIVCFLISQSTLKNRKNEA